MYANIMACIQLVVIVLTANTCCALGVGLNSGMFFNGEDDLKMMSCQGVCGTNRALPCNCDSRCTLFKNCCEDFAIVCPQLFQESRNRYRYLENSSVVCNKSLGQSIIMECPTSERGHKEFTNLTLFHANKDTMTLNPSKWEAFGQQLTTFIDNLPVYDVATGLVYLNWEVHQCNTKGRKAIPVLWRQQILSDTQSSFRNLEELTMILNSKASIYLPPLGYEEDLKGSSCWTNYIDSCSENFNDTIIADKCESFSSFVTPTLGKPIYKNHYCLQCNGNLPIGLHPVSFIKEHKQEFRFSFILSLTNTHLDVELLSHRQDISMETSRCQLKFESMDTNAPCALRTACPSPLKMNSIGQCKGFYSLRTAFGDDDLPLSFDEEVNLKAYVECFLKKHAGNAFDSMVFKQQIKFFDTTTMTVMHVVTMNDIQFTEEDIPVREDIYVLQDTMAKLFYAYRFKKSWNAKNSSGVLQQGTIGNKRTSQEHTVQFSENSRSSFSMQAQSSHIFQRILDNDFSPDSEERNEKPAQILENSFASNVSVCSCNLPLTINEDMGKKCWFLVCWKTPISKEDINKLLELKSASCLDLISSYIMPSKENFLCSSVKLICMCLLGVSALFTLH